MADSAIDASGPPLVLIVDDHADGREMCTTLLGLAGFRTAESADGAGAIAQAAALAPDCILMDLSLPGVDGWEATRRLKADRRTRGIPVIAVSGQSIPDRDARAAGFAACVTKPCTPEEVLAAIRSVLEGA